MKGSKSVHKNRIAKTVRFLPKSGIRDFFEVVSTMDDVISLGIGEPDFVTPWNIREAAIFSLEKGHTGYTSNLGMLSLRKAICKAKKIELGIDYNPEKEAIITVGVSEALDLILRAILDPGDEVIYHEPCYVSYNPVITICHAKPVPVITRESNNFALDPDDLEKAITNKTKAILLNFPCNPTGANISFEQKKRIAELAVKYDLIVISDEIYTDLTYSQMTQSISAFPGMRERTVYLNGFSKAYAMTGFRIGYALGPSDLIDAMMNIHQYSMLCVPTTAQDAAIEAIENTDSEKNIMKNEYWQRRNLIVKGFNNMGLSCAMPEGAFYVFPNVSSTGLSGFEFSTQLLKSKKVAVVPGSAFSSSAKNYIRCSYATSTEQIKLALSGINDFINEIK